MHVLRLPPLGVNDDSATIYWQVEDGASVHKGQVVVLAETTKATIDVVADDAGYVYPSVPSGERAEVGDALGLVHESATLNAKEVQHALTAGAPATTQTDQAERQWTRKAKLLADARGVRIEEIPSIGPVIQESDVAAYLDVKAQPQQVGTNGATPTRMYTPGLRQRILVVGGAGGGTQVIDMLARTPDMQAAAVVDNDASLKGKLLLGVPVVGTVADVQQLWKEHAFDAAVVAIIADRVYRRELFQQLRDWGIPMANVVDPTATVRFGVQMGQGNIIRAFCHLAAHTVLGDNNFLADYVNLEHQNQVGSHCTFGPFVSTSARVHIGDATRFGTGVFIEPDIEIGANSIIASGTVLVGNVPPNSLVKTKLNYTITPIHGDR